MANNGSEFEKLRSGFSRLNEATVESNLVPQLNDLFQQRGLEMAYMLFDADEFLAQFPLTVRTRYIMPVPADENTQYGEFCERVLEQEKMLPGIVLAERLDFKGKTIYVTPSLNSGDMAKIGQRMEAIARNEHIDDLSWRKPDWWPYPYRVSDETRPYDFGSHIAPFQRKSRLERGKFVGRILDRLNRRGRIRDNEDAGVPLDTYMWRSIPEIVFAERTDDGKVVRKWEQHEEDVKAALSKMSDLLDKNLAK